MAKKTLKIKDLNPDKFWGAVQTIKDSDGEQKFGTISKFALYCLSLPHSNADCERCFSNINRIKTKDRNKLKVRTVRNILLAKQSVTTNPANSCISFKPSRTMLRRMTTDSLYPQGGSEKNDKQVIDVDVFFAEGDDE